MSRIANENVSIARGSRGAEVGNLQRFLVETNHKGIDGKTLTVDERFGPNTEHALRELQRTIAIPATGVLDTGTRRAIGPLGFVPFVQAQSCRIHWPSRRAVRAIVIHTMECQESSLTAGEDVALWFAGKSVYPAPKASAHYCVDRDSIVQCVRDTDEAWHASQANTSAIGIEHAGFAGQTADEWSDSASEEILWRSASLAARLCRLYAIPVRRLTLTQIATGEGGFCGHVDVNSAFGNHAGHTDPGRSFPWASYLALVAEKM